MPLISVSFEHRTIRPKEIYRLPPSPNFDISSMPLLVFQRIVSKSDKQDIVRFLASELSLGSAYSEEILSRVGIQKNTPLGNLSHSDIEKIHSCLMQIIHDIENLNISPSAVLSSGNVIDYIPFDMKSYEGFPRKKFESFNDCLDYVFSGWFEESIKLEREKRFSEKLSLLEKRLEEQKSVISGLQKQSQEFKSRAELIYKNLSTIDTILSTIINSRRSNMSWQELKRLVKEDQEKEIYEASLIREIREDESVIVLNLDSGIELDFTISASENANLLFEQAKKLESKIEGAEKSIADTQDKIYEFSMRKEELTSVKEAEKPREITRKKEEWYHAFRWFKTSKGHLVVAGRDATQNEILIKKHLEVSDLVFHADVYGSPFAVLKDGRTAEKEELEQTAHFVASYSSAWKTKIPCDVYYVSPSQVSKQAPSGEYIARGAFMIYGKKNYFRSLLLGISVGITIINETADIVAGPESALKAYCKSLVNIVPGDEKPSDTAKNILRFLKYKEGDIISNFKADDIIKLLPAGTSKIVNY